MAQLAAVHRAQEHRLKALKPPTFLHDHDKLLVIDELGCMRLSQIRLQAIPRGVFTRLPEPAGGPVGPFQPGAI